MLNRSPSSRETLLKVVSDVRRRWRLKIALRGAAFLVGGGLFLTLLSSWGLDAFRFGLRVVEGNAVTRVSIVIEDHLAIELF